MAEEKKPTCGIIMPISAIDGCTEAHWLEVREILSDSIIAAGFEPNLVSEAEDVGMIQKRIVQNLYENPVVVCDVSGKNPNVMFELGMRLAFDKPTIVIKDNQTGYSFDTSPIEHLDYPRDLRYSSIVDFKIRLSEKIKATHKAGEEESYTTFLKHFGEFKVAKINKTEVSGQEYIIEELKSIRDEIRRIDSAASRRSQDRTSRMERIHIGAVPDDEFSINLPAKSSADLEEVFDKLRRMYSFAWVYELNRNESTGDLEAILCAPGVSEGTYKKIVDQLGPDATLKPPKKKRPAR